MFTDRVHIKERFLNDLRKARDQYKGEELVKVGNIYKYKLILTGPVYISVIQEAVKLPGNSMFVICISC